MPEENEVVICTVKEIKRQSVFVNMDEYKYSEAVISISEVSPGRIRNIRNYVQVGKKIYCKVLRVDSTRKQVDLSLRRVNQKERIDKNTELRKENLAETILKLTAKEFNLKLEDFYKIKFEKILSEYYYLFEFFEEWLLDESVFDVHKLDISQEQKKYIYELIKTRFKKPLIEVRYSLKIRSESENGLEKIRTPIINYLKDSDNIEIYYLGGGRYQAKIVGENFKDEENKMQKFLKYIESEYNKEKVSLTYEKIE